MTIKELEERTGMPRANIRYYEEEKLISPQRLPNGYRDYSEEDANTLEKIKLLRQLHLDIDTIRLVQQGQLTLEQALFNQLTRLEGDKNSIDRALEVCRKLERSGVEYAALDPGYWLRELKKPVLPPAAAPAKPAPPREELTEAELWTRRNPASDHPWMRYFARVIDVMLTGLVIDLLGWLVIPAYVTIDPPLLVDWLLAFAELAFALAVEPLWLHYWGYTPGKWIFGLKVRDRNGEKLSISEGYERSFRVMRYGYGFQIPIYNLYRLWKGRKCCVNGEDCPWDADEGYLYGREERRRYGLYFAGVYVLAFVVALFLVLGSYLPRHHSKDGLTVEQFSENYNYVLKLHDLEDYKRLQEDGTWEVETVPSGAVVIDPYKIQWHDPEFTVEDGKVTAVSLTMEGETDLPLRWNWYQTRDTVLLLAFSGAHDVNLFNYDSDGWIKVWDEFNADYWQDYELDYRGFHITIDCDAVGYQNLGSSDYLVPDEGDVHHVTRTVTISLTGSDG